MKKIEKIAYYNNIVDIKDDIDYQLKGRVIKDIVLSFDKINEIIDYLNNQKHI